MGRKPSGQGYTVNADYNRLSVYLSADIENLEEIPDESSEADEEEYEKEKISRVEKITLLLEMIPKKEADFLELYYIRKKKQSEIANIFQVSQAAVSYRLKRAVKRIKFLLKVPVVDEDTMRRDLSKYFPIIDINIMVGLWRSTCQSTVANELQLTQGRVRHRFFKALELLNKLADENKELEPYRALFVMIGTKNFNILKEVKLPQWANRGQDICMLSR